VICSISGSGQGPLCSQTLVQLAAVGIDKIEILIKVTIYFFLLYEALVIAKSKCWEFAKLLPRLLNLKIRERVRCLLQIVSLLRPGDGPLWVAEST
jgi:hypothetical protein